VQSAPQSQSPGYSRTRSQAATIHFNSLLVERRPLRSCSPSWPLQSSPARLIQKCAHHAKRVPLHTTPVEPPCPFVAARLEARMSTCATHVPLHPALTRNVHIHAQRSLSIKTPRATRKRQKSHKTGARALVCLAAPLPPKCPVHGRHTPVQAVPRKNHHCQSGAAPLASLRSIHYDRCPSLASRSTPSPPPSLLPLFDVTTRPLGRGRSHGSVRPTRRRTSRIHNALPPPRSGSSRRLPLPRP